MLGYDRIDIPKGIDVNKNKNISRKYAVYVSFITF